jgi:3'-phosphoadenosine 5'-phosphosulfate sulfotransferase (PAPS reductase)/FAD synthetase
MSTATRIEADLREIAEAGAAELGPNATAEELLRWTARTFGTDFIVASNMQDAVLIDVAKKAIDPELLDGEKLKVLFLDTGYHFAETIGTRDAVEQVYDVEMVNVTPEHTVAQQDQLLGRNLFARDAAECCRLRKVVPLQNSLARLPGLGHRHPPRRGADSRQRAADLVRRGLRAGEDQPARRVERRADAGLHRRQRRPGQSPCGRGLSVHRLRALHAEAGRGSRSAQRPLGR